MSVAPFANNNEYLDYQRIGSNGQSAFQTWRAKDPNHRTYAQWKATQQGISFTATPAPAPAPAAPAPAAPAAPSNLNAIGLTPQQMGQYLESNFGISSQRVGAENDLQDVLAQDPLIQKQIAYNQQVGNRAADANAAARGVNFSGIHDSDLWDVDRAFKIAEENQALAVRRAHERHDAIIGNLDTNQSALDLNRVAQARENASATPPAPYVPKTTKPVVTGKTTYTVDPKTNKPTVYPGKDWSQVAQMFESDPRYTISSKAP